MSSRFRVERTLAAPSRSRTTREQRILALASRPEGVSATELVRRGEVGDLAQGESFLAAFVTCKLGVLVNGKLFAADSARLDRGRP